MIYDYQKKIIDSNYTWNLRRQKSILAPAKAKSLSPNGRWLILEYSIHQDPEDRYESEIDDAEFILFDLESANPEKEIGRFRFYYNYNSSADWKEISGSKFKWGEGDANLILGESILNLEELTNHEILENTKKFNI